MQQLPHDVDIINLSLGGYTDRDAPPLAIATALQAIGEQRTPWSRPPATRARSGRSGRRRSLGPRGRGRRRPRRQVDARRLQQLRPLGRRHRPRHQPPVHLRPRHDQGRPGPDDQPARPVDRLRRLGRLGRHLVRHADRRRDDRPHDVAQPPPLAEAPDLAARDRAAGAAARLPERRPARRARGNARALLGRLPLDRPAVRPRSQEALMTNRADFSEEEWTRLKRAPFVAGMAISLADPGGPIELVKETAATLKTVRTAAESGGRGELVDALAREVVSQPGEHKNPLHDFKPKGALAGQEILEELAEVNRIVTAKATAGGSERLSRVASDGRPRGRQRGQRGRLPRLPRRARERGRAADARQARRGARGTGLKIGRRSGLIFGAQTGRYEGYATARTIRQGPSRRGRPGRRLPPADPRPPRADRRLRTADPARRRPARGDRERAGAGDRRHRPAAARRRAPRARRRHARVPARRPAAAALARERRARGPGRSARRRRCC